MAFFPFTFINTAFWAIAKYTWQVKATGYNWRLAFALTLQLCVSLRVQCLLLTVVKSHDSG